MTLYTEVVTICKDVSCFQLADYLAVHVNEMVLKQGIVANQIY